MQIAGGRGLLAPRVVSPARASRLSLSRSGGLRRSPAPQFRTLPSGPTFISCSLSAPATLISYWTAEPSFSTSAS